MIHFYVKELSAYNKTKIIILLVNKYLPSNPNTIMYT